MALQAKQHSMISNAWLTGKLLAVLQFIIVTALSLLAWYGKDIAGRMRSLELNQVKILTVLKIDAVADTENTRKTGGFSVQKQGLKQSNKSNVQSFTRELGDVTPEKRGKYIDEKFLLYKIPQKPDKISVSGVFVRDYKL